MLTSPWVTMTDENRGPILCILIVILAGLFALSLINEKARPYGLVESPVPCYTEPKR